MKYGYYADNEIPKSIADNERYRKQYKLNKQGYRCPEFSPLPEGGKNVVVLGCSHTFGEGLEDDEVWISQLEKLYYSKKNNTTLTNLRFWNLGHPGASHDLCVRILYGIEKILFPKIIIICWPIQSRRERLDKEPINLTGDNPLLKFENRWTDYNNFLKCLFQIEKFATYNNAKTFHCFADESLNPTDYTSDYDKKDNVRKNNLNILTNPNLKTCWPEWDRHIAKGAKREHISEPNLAKDGIHYGPEHHKTFANLFYNTFKTKLK
jgi:hypothetical protein